MSEIAPEILQDEFYQISNNLADQYDFPELGSAVMHIVANGHNEKRDDVFPMRSIESRKLSFEFSIDRYVYFTREFSAWLEDQPIARKQELEKVGRFLFIGAAAVRPIIEFDQVRVLQSRGPRHTQVLRNFYDKKEDIDGCFAEIFSGKQSKFKTVAADIKETDVPKINGYRVMLSYLYGGYSDDPNVKAVFSELLRDSRAAIVDVVTNQHPDFCRLGRSYYGSESGLIGNFLTASLLPNWLLALAVPITKESYDHLCSHLWEEKFHIEPAEIAN